MNSNPAVISFLNEVETPRLRRRARKLLDGKLTAEWRKSAYAVAHKKMTSEQSLDVGKKGTIGRGSRKG